METFDDIRFFHSDEVNPALQSAVRHPMIKELFAYTFPNKSEDEIKDIVLSCHSIDELQRKVISKTMLRLLDETSAGLTTSGFDELDKDTPYLYISNHRDIVLDTSLINVVLFDHDLIRTASAIGDNLVQRPFVNALSKLNRNFVVKRGAGPRETLLSSQKLSKFIQHLLHERKRSVWIAQRQGRTKDGNDTTEQGVLKMIGLAAGKQPIAEFLNNLRIVPISISYEYDPTDILKVPELLAKAANEEYIKTENEDFNSILKGALGQKKHIHIAAGKPLHITADAGEGTNQVLQRVVQQLDDTIQFNYRLWPTNYIAHDLVHNSQTNEAHYTEQDKNQFERRLRLRVNSTDEKAVASFLSMYARPVANKELLKSTHEA